MNTRKVDVPRQLAVSVMAQYYRIVQPGISGLPRWWVILWFPIACVLVLGVLTALGISGSSSGAHWFALGSGTDPRLLEGQPRTIRSDEWLVQQSWIVSQANQGFPIENQTFPGGSDVTVLNDLPTWDWSTIFRPHLWGYLFFGLDVGIAWHWWAPAVGVLSSAYVFVNSLLPKRPMTSAMIATAVFFTPFLQWWYMPSTLWCAAWPLLGMAATIWVLRDDRLWVRITWSAVAGYFAVTLAMGLYLPFIIPGLLVFLFFAFGYLVARRADGELRYPALLKRALPFFIAGVVAGCITGVYALSRWGTFDSILSTVYPGQRLDPTGKLPLVDPYFTGILGAPWNGTLMNTAGMTLLGGNSSEGASVFLIPLFVLPGLLYFAIRSLLGKRRPDWVLLFMLGCFALIVAYLLIPGWDALAHLLQLDRIPPERFRMAFVVLAPVFAALVIQRVDAGLIRRSWALGFASAVFTALIMFYLWAQFKLHGLEVLALSSKWKLVVPLIIIATFAIYLKKLVPVGAGALLIASILVGWGVNPLYKGVFDLSDTKVGDAIERIDDAGPGAWVAVGSAEAMAILVETGVESYSGVQNYPSEELWESVDPDGEYESNWNRLGHIRWSFGEGEPVVENPQGDVISVTIDPCSEFAQENVSYILSEVETDSACVRELDEIQQGAIRMFIYEIVPTGGS